MKNKLPSVITLIILTFITIIFWVSFNIYTVFTKKAPIVVSEEILLPLDPKLDTEIINQIEGKNYP